MAAVMHAAIESAMAGFTRPGQLECGDHHVIASTPEGVLVVVIDGLGHGHEACVAAELAATHIREHAPRSSLIELVNSCHTALIATRGVVMSLASFDATQSTMTWLGIGDVEGRLLVKDPKSGYLEQHLLLRQGIVGNNLPRLLASTIYVHSGDILILATDGITADFSEDISMAAPVGRIAEGIISAYSKRTDDALTLVVRYLG